MVAHKYTDVVYIFLWPACLLYICCKERSGCQISPDLRDAEATADAVGSQFGANMIE